MEDWTLEILKKILNCGEDTFKEIEKIALCNGFTPQGIEARYFNLLPCISVSQYENIVRRASEYCSIEKDDEGNITAIKIWFDKKAKELLAEFSEEYDSSREMWSFYNEIYKKVFNNIQNEKITVEVKGKKDKRYLRYHKVVEGYQLAGDVCFNFKRTKLKKLIDTVKCDRNCRENDKNEIINIIEMVREYHHSVENVSLMLTTGNMQGTKQQIGNDRFDVFCYAIDEYCKGVTSWVLAHSTPQNKGILIDYLNERCDDNGEKKTIKYFEDIFMLKMDDECLISDLLDSGKKSIDSAERVLEYILLAYRLWICRAIYYENNYIDQYKKMNGNSSEKLIKEKNGFLSLLNKIKNN